MDDPADRRFIERLSHGGLVVVLRERSRDDTAQSVGPRFERGVFAQEALVQWLLGARRANSADDFRSVMAWVGLVLPSDVLVLDVGSAGSVQAIDWINAPMSTGFLKGPTLHSAAENATAERETPAARGKRSNSRGSP